MGSHMHNLTSISGTSDDNWATYETENEDPNLLDNPELLFQECSKLPPPEQENQEAEEEFLEAVKLTRELILDHNLVFEAISKREEFTGTKEEAQQVIENLISTFERDCYNTTEVCARQQNMPLWDELVKKKHFSSRGAERITRWKTSLNSFLDGYLKIREYIQKDSLEDREEGEQAETEQENCKYLIVIIEELKTFMESLDSIE